MESFSEDDLEWGNSFTIARGNASICLKYTNPKGHCGFLGYKAEEDLLILRHLWEKRMKEAQQVFSHILIEETQSEINNLRF